MLQTPFEVASRTPKYKDKQAYFYHLAKAFEFYERARADGLIRSYGFTANESIRLDPEAVVKNLHFNELQPNGEVNLTDIKIAPFEVQQLYETFDIVIKVCGKNHGLNFFQVPFNLR